MNESSTRKTKLNLNIDYRWIALILAAAIILMLLIWKPWSGGETDRTVQVSGQATLRARPDRFIFYPTYNFKNKDKEAALEQMTAKSESIVTGLKKLGVADKDIKTNSDSWSYPSWETNSKDSTTYTLRLTVTVDSDSLAQKIQDYLLTTSPSGSISPLPTFSDQKRKEIEDKARDQATKDARTRAEQSAENLGFRLAAVKEVNDGAGFGGSLYPGMGGVAEDSKLGRSSMTIQPGENELTYRVTVTYFIR